MWPSVAIFFTDNLDSRRSYSTQRGTWEFSIPRCPRYLLNVAAGANIYSELLEDQKWKLHFFLLQVDLERVDREWGTGWTRSVLMGGYVIVAREGYVIYLSGVLLADETDVTAFLSKRCKISHF